MAPISTSTSSPRQLPRSSVTALWLLTSLTTRARDITHTTATRVTAAATTCPRSRPTQCPARTRTRVEMTTTLIVTQSARDPTLPTAPRPHLPPSLTTRSRPRPTTLHWRLQHTRHVSDRMVVASTSPRSATCRCSTPPPWPPWNLNTWTVSIIARTTRRQPHLLLVRVSR